MVFLGLVMNLTVTLTFRAVEVHEPAIRVMEVNIDAQDAQGDAADEGLGEERNRHCYN